VFVKQRWIPVLRAFADADRPLEGSEASFESRIEAFECADGSPTRPRLAPFRW